MGTRAIMTMRATLERNQGAADPYKGKEVRWMTLSVTPCYAWASGFGKQTNYSNYFTVTTDLPGMVVPKGTDVTNHDRVLIVKDRLGNTIFPTIMYIDSVVYRKDHIAIRLRNYG